MRERGDFTPTEHITVLLSHRSGTKLLGTPLEQGTGRDQAEAIKHILNAWNLEEQSVAMCFDTTASNTGKFQILENLMIAAFFWKHFLIILFCGPHVVITYIKSV